MANLKSALNKALKLPKDQEVDEVHGGRYGYYISIRHKPQTIEGDYSVVSEWSIMDLIDDHIQDKKSECY